jgi:hypothetical protein
MIVFVIGRSQMEMKLLLRVQTTWQLIVIYYILTLACLAWPMLKIRSGVELEK